MVIGRGMGGPSPSALFDVTRVILLFCFACVFVVCSFFVCVCVFFQFVGTDRFCFSCAGVACYQCRVNYLRHDATALYVHKRRGSTHSYPGVEGPMLYFVLYMYVCIRLHAVNAGRYCVDIYIFFESVTTTVELSGIIPVVLE